MIWWMDEGKDYGRYAVVEWTRKLMRKGLPGLLGEWGNRSGVSASYSSPASADLPLPSSWRWVSSSSLARAFWKSIFLPAS